MLAQEAVEGLLLPDDERTRLNAGVVQTQDSVDVVERLRAHIRELLDLRGHVLDLWKARYKIQNGGRCEEGGKLRT